MNEVYILNTLVIVAIVITAAISAFSKKALTSVLALGITGGFVSLEFILLHAPDVAISEAAVGAVLTTALFIIAIKKTTKKEDEEK